MSRTERPDPTPPKVDELTSKSDLAGNSQRKEGHTTGERAPRILRNASPYTGRALRVVLAMTVAFATSFLLDRGLGVLGYPSMTPRRIAHPPNFVEVRSNIEFEYHFETNAYGLRYREIPPKKPEDTFRVFVVGDSFTEGVGVEADAAFPSVLERIFWQDGIAVNFINGGLGGTGPLQYARVFSGVGLKYEPDGLLICIYQNDLSNMRESIDSTDLWLFEPALHGSFLKMLFYAISPRIYTMLKKVRYDFERSRDNGRDQPGFVAGVSEWARDLGIPDDRIAEWESTVPRDLVTAVNEGKFNGAILSYGLTRPYYFTDALDIATPRAERKWQSMLVSLEEMTAVAAQNGVEVGLVYIPSQFQYDADSYRPTSPWLISGVVIRREWLLGQSEIQKRLYRWSTDKDIPLLDLTDTFRQATLDKPPLSLNWRLDGHWSPLGHEVAADAIHEWLKAHQVFSFLR